MRVRSFRSGSSGNALLIQSGGRAILVDAGGSIRRLTSYLLEAGVHPGQLAAILLTHEHSDHIAAAAAVAKSFDAPVIANAATLAAARLGGSSSQVLPTGQTIDFGETPAAPAIAVTSFGISHDCAEPVGYVVRSGGWSVAIATDLGFASVSVVEAMRGADLLVLEANHDIDLLRQGPYPAHLKRRILSERGHLSNEQAAEVAIAALGGRPQRFWLAHLSTENNHPTLARQAVARALAGARADESEVEVLDRLRPGPVFDTSLLASQPRLFPT